MKRGVAAFCLTAAVAQFVFGQTTERQQENRPAQTPTARLPAPPPVVSPEVPAEFAPLLFTKQAK